MILETGHPLYTYILAQTQSVSAKPVLYLVDSGESMAIISTPGLVRSQLQFLESTSYLRSPGEECRAVKLENLDELRDYADSIPEVRGIVFYTPDGVSEPISWSEVFGSADLR